MIRKPERIAFGWQLTLLQPERENTPVWYICSPLEADIVKTAHLRRDDEGSFHNAVTGTVCPAIRCRDLRSGNQNADKPERVCRGKFVVPCDHPYVFRKAHVCRGKRAAGLNGVTLLPARRVQSDA